MSGRSNSIWNMTAAVGAAVAFTARQACAQLADESAGDAVAQGALTWQQILENGGWLLWVLAVMSILALALVIYFFFILRVSQVAPRPLRREIIEKIEGGALEDVRRACEYRPCPLAAVTVTGLQYVQNAATVDSGLLKDVIQGEGTRQAEVIEGQTQYLLDIGAIAPMVGLLGTVFGMLRAFSGVALNIANAKPVVLAGGVSQALITTACGLMVGIPSMMFYAYFRRRAARLVSYLESASTDVLTALLGKRSE